MEATQPVHTFKKLSRVTKKSWTQTANNFEWERERETEREVRSDTVLVYTILNPLIFSRI